MQLGFVSAILADLSLEEVLRYASQNGFACVELMCWPVGKAERRYAGVTHIDVTNFDQAEATRIKDLAAQYGVAISGLGYYPNPLTPDMEERQTYVEHIKKVIAASGLLGINVMNTFIGRDHTRPIEDQWTTFEEVWKPLITFAEQQKVRIGIENCPMLFSLDEWPGGKNMAISPEIWRRMFSTIPSDYFGLNFDPSHLIWQHIDYIRAIHEFKDQTVPRSRQRRKDRRGFVLQSRHARPEMARPEAARPGRRELVALLRGASRSGLQRTGVHRSRRSGF